MVIILAMIDDALVVFLKKIITFRQGQINLFVLIINHHNNFGGNMEDWLNKYKSRMAYIRTVCSFIAMTLSIIIFLKIFKII